MICDFTLVTQQLADQFEDLWMEKESKSGGDNKDEEIVIPKLKGNSNWIAFKDIFLLKLRVVAGLFFHSMEYLIDSKIHQAQRSNAKYIIFGHE